MLLSVSRRAIRAKRLVGSPLEACSVNSVGKQYLPFLPGKEVVLLTCPPLAVQAPLDRGTFEQFPLVSPCAPAKPLLNDPLGTGLA